MSFDLLVKNANLPDGRTHMAIACRGGRIEAVEAGITAEAGKVIEANGRLVSPPFVDSHFHMDATLSLGLPRMNRSGTLLEGIALWGELKEILTVDAVVERALKYCDLAVSQGLLAIRSHVDVCDVRLTGVKGLLEVRERVRDYIDLQLVAFPQDGLFRSPNAEKNLLTALDMGVDIVGGILHRITGIVSGVFHGVGRIVHHVVRIIHRVVHHVAGVVHAVFHGIAGIMRSVFHGGASIVHHVVLVCLFGRRTGHQGKRRQGGTKNQSCTHQNSPS